MKKYAKKITALLLSAVMLLSAVWLLSSCGRAPKTEDIYDRVVELIEGSYELNTVFLGAGMPTYARDSEYADFTHMYYNFAHGSNYAIITEQAKFLTEQDIRNAAERIYSTAYLEKVAYPAAFDGYAMDDGMGDAAVSYARYLSDAEYFCLSASDKNYLDGMRIYDYSTMKVVKPSKANACYVTLDSYLEKDPAGTVTPVRLRLVKQDDGQWYLDSFTG